MKNNQLKDIRKKLDKIDNKLLKLIKKRTKLVDIVIKIKKHKKDIVDKKRIKQILKRIKLQSKKMNVDIEITKKIWISMINAYIKYERKKF
tara:strand:- start:894 stop:1166 length:273 start_codon:yes stop_codon:yes gene_type:complete